MSAVYEKGQTEFYMKRNVFENNGWALKIQASCSGVVLELNNFIGTMLTLEQMDFWS